MIMGLLIGLLLRGGKFLTLAARQTLWHMFETNDYGPKIVLDNDNWFKLTRGTKGSLNFADKDIQTSEEVICLRKGYKNIIKYASAGDSCKIKSKNRDLTEREVDLILDNLDKIAAERYRDGSLKKLLDELERKIQGSNETTFLPQEPEKNKTNRYASLKQCISKFQVKEQEFIEPLILQPPTAFSHLKSAISDDLRVKYGRPCKYLKRITEQVSSAHNSLPNLTNKFYTSRSFHTKTESSSRRFTRNSFQTMENEAIRKMLDNKIKLLAEKQNERNKRNTNRTEIKEREKLLEINQKAFRKVEDDLKTVKIINKASSSNQFIDELFLLLDDNPKINFLKNLKIHKQLPCYESTKSTEFIVHLKPNHITPPNLINEILQNKSISKLNMDKLKEEIDSNCKPKEINNVKRFVQFMSYEQIPRICHLNKQSLENEITAKFVSHKTTESKFLINREWEKLNLTTLHEEIMLKYISNNKTLELRMSTMKTIKEKNIDLKNITENHKKPTQKVSTRGNLYSKFIEQRKLRAKQIEQIKPKKVDKSANSLVKTVPLKRLKRREAKESKSETSKADLGKIYMKNKEPDKQNAKAAEEIVEQNAKAAEEIETKVIDEKPLHKEIEIIVETKSEEPSVTEMKEPNSALETNFTGQPVAATKNVEIENSCNVTSPEFTDSWEISEPELSPQSQADPKDISASAQLKSNEEILKQAPDVEKDIENPIAGISQPKSRIPVRKSPSTDSAVTQTCLTRYKNEKTRGTMPNLRLSLRKKLQRLRKPYFKKGDRTKLPLLESVREVEEHDSDKLEKLALNKKSTESKMSGKNDVALENEMPPDFDVLEEIDLVDISADEEIPMKNKTTVYSEKKFADTKYCLGPEQEKELLAILLDKPNLEEKQAKKEVEKPKEIEETDTKSEVEELELSMTEKPSMQIENNEVEQKFDENKNPVQCSPSLQNIWNKQQPKAEVDPESKKNDEKDGEVSKKQEEGEDQKKYKMETDEFEGIDGRKFKVTKLVEDV